MSQLKRFAVIGFLLFSLPLFAAVSATAHWNVRTDGANTNGGFFDPGVISPGTDYSAQASAQISFTDIVVGATTSTFTSVLNAATTASPGNGIYISGGSGCTVGWYEILSQSGGTYTMDRSLGTAASVCTGNLGGGLLTIAQSATNSVNGNTIYIKSGTYADAAVVQFNAVPLSISGYGSTYNDNGTRPVISSSDSNGRIFNLNNGGLYTLSNLSFSGTASKGPAIFTGGGPTSVWVFYCYATGFGSGGQDGGGFIDDTNGSNSYFYDIGIYFSEITSSAQVVSGSTGTASNLYIKGNYFHGNTATFTPMKSTSVITLEGNIFAAQTATPAADLQIGTAYALLVGNIFYGDAGPAISFANSNFGTVALFNNIFYGNYQAIDNTGSAFPFSSPTLNAYGANTNANTSFYVSPLDITLTANPFVNAGSGNFALNSTSGGGPLLTATGWPLKFGSGTTNYLNIGAVQGGGGTTVLVTGFAY